MVSSRLDNFLDAFLIADVAGIYAQASRARLSCLNAPFVVKMDIRNDGHIHVGNDFFQCL